MREAEPILVADADREARSWLRTIVGDRFGLDEVDTGDAALARIAAGGARILVVGRQLTDTTGEALLERTAAFVSDRRMPVTFLLAGADGATPAIDDAEVPVFYRLVRGMEPGRVSELMNRAAARLPPPPPRESDPACAAIVRAHATAIGAELDPAGAARAAVAAVIELVDADRARCLYCDDESGVLWPGDSSASAGLAGFAVRAGVGVIVPRAGDDPLYRAEIDDPGSTGRERLAVQPVAGPDGHVHAVLIAVRGAARPPFTTAELDRLEALAAAWGPYLVYLELRLEADAILGDQLDRGPSDLFRQQAITHLVRRGQRGDVIRIHPGWIPAAYWLVLASLAAALIFAAIAPIRQYAGGAAVALVTGSSELLAHEAGTIDSLGVVRGQRVERDQVVARLHDAEQVGQLRALETEFESALVAYLQSPGDPQVKQALGESRAQRDRARLGVEARTIRAPRAGIVTEVLARNGQRVVPGTAVLSILEDAGAEGVEVVAFLPGSERPRLRLHQPLRLTLPGYGDAHITGEVDAISEVLGATEARARFLSDRRGDGVPAAGPVVVVEARLSSRAFESDGQTLQLHDGMVGAAEVQTRSCSLLQSLIPGLR
ncbi:MAG TPA: HlyD family efflux transporter periplasmic adaptor subunit [Kofleriaceae bacterium]|jgi:membrane fusion protein (multidrug efflux system)|nr:HlyD family efflux transporter periplasmic adaptor subunit [Kofleriaceae bacterium]